MALKKFKPTSEGRRTMTVEDHSGLSKEAPMKSKIAPGGRSGGRNNRGRITNRRIGGGAKRRLRIVDFLREKDSVPAKVAAIEYDPNRSAHLARLHYLDGEKRYILAPLGIGVGDVLVSGPDADIKPGNTLPLKNIPVGTLVHAVEMKPAKGAQLGRSAGSEIQLMAKEGPYAFIKLPSGELRKVRLECRATVGQVGNAEHENVSIGKAGRSRWLGVKPVVRGIAKNPVDHPHGGGEGRSKGNHPQTPWGKPTKGYKTRRNKATDKYIITRRSRK